MKIEISPQATSHFIREMDLRSGDYVRFYVKYGGHSTIQTSYSLGISFEPPTKAGASVEVDGITFYVEQTDLWYFEDYNLAVLFNEELQEIEYDYRKD